MPDIDLLKLFLSFVFGLIMGSFFNVCIHRLPSGESVVFPPSHCPYCKTHLRFYDNIPLLSYLLLLGRCRYCKSRISPVYPVVELLSGLISMLLFWRFGLTLQTLFLFSFLSALLVVSFIDIRHMIIPNVITLPGIAVGLLYSGLNTNWYVVRDFSKTGWSVVIGTPIMDSLVGVALGAGMLLLIGGIYELVRKKEGLGMGDVKLLAMIGAFLGWKGVLFVAFASSVLGTLVGVLVMLYRGKDLGYALPFGPFLSLAAAIYCFIGGFGSL